MESLMENQDWKNILRLIAVKTLGIVLALVFFSLGVLFVGYCLVSVAGTTKGQNATILSFAGKMGERPTACRVGGLFTVTADMAHKKYEKIYTLYPAWPDILSPMKGDVIRIWPARQPLVGTVPLDGWGWFIVGTLMIVGLVFFEFAFLVLTVG